MTYIHIPLKKAFTRNAAKWWYSKVPDPCAVEVGHTFENSIITSIWPSRCFRCTPLHHLTRWAPGDFDISNGSSGAQMSEVLGEFCFKRFDWNLEDLRGCAEVKLPSRVTSLTSYWYIVLINFQTRNPTGNSSTCCDTFKYTHLGSSLWVVVKPPFSTNTGTATEPAPPLQTQENSSLVQFPLQPAVCWPTRTPYGTRTQIQLALHCVFFRMDFRGFFPEFSEEKPGGK